MLFWRPVAKAQASGPPELLTDMECAAARAVALCLQLGCSGQVQNQPEPSVCLSKGNSVPEFPSLQMWR